MNINYVKQKITTLHLGLASKADPLVTSDLQKAVRGLWTSSVQQNRYKGVGQTPVHNYSQQAPPKKPLYPTSLPVLCWYLQCTGWESNEVESVCLPKNSHVAVLGERAWRHCYYQAVTTNIQQNALLFLEQSLLAKENSCKIIQWKTRLKTNVGQLSFIHYSNIPFIVR